MSATLRLPLQRLKFVLIMMLLSGMLITPLLHVAAFTAVTLDESESLVVLNDDVTATSTLTPDCPISLAFGSFSNSGEVYLVLTNNAEHNITLQGFDVVWPDYQLPAISSNAPHWKLKYVRSGNGDEASDAPVIWTAPGEGIEHGNTASAPPYNNRTTDEMGDLTTASIPPGTTNFWLDFNGIETSLYDYNVRLWHFDTSRLELDCAEPATPTSTLTLEPTETPTPTASATFTTTATSTETPEATASATVAATVAPTETATPTATLPVATELLTNGDFEDGLTGWTPKNPTGDKVKCNKPEKIFAYTGNCAYLFKGGVGEKSQLVQTITPAGGDFAAGDTLNFAGFVKAKGNVNAVAKVVVTYADSTLSKGKLKAKVKLPTDGYQPINETLLLATAPASIKVQFSNKSTSGKVYIDALSLTATASAQLLPLP